MYVAAWKDTGNGSAVVCSQVPETNQGGKGMLPSSSSNARETHMRIPLVRVFRDFV